MATYCFYTKLMALPHRFFFFGGTVFFVVVVVVVWFPVAHQVGVVEPHRFLVRARVCWIRFDATKKNGRILVDESADRLPVRGQLSGWH